MNASGSVDHQMVKKGFGESIFWKKISSTTIEFLWRGSIGGIVLLSILILYSGRWLFSLSGYFSAIMWCTAWSFVAMKYYKQKRWTAYISSFIMSLSVALLSRSPIHQFYGILDYVDAIVFLLLIVELCIMISSGKSGRNWCLVLLLIIIAKPLAFWNDECSENIVRDHYQQIEEENRKRIEEMERMAETKRKKDDAVKLISERLFEVGGFKLVKGSNDDNLIERLDLAGLKDKDKHRALIIAVRIYKGEDPFAVEHDEEQKEQFREQQKREQEEKEKTRRRPDGKTGSKERESNNASKSPGVTSGAEKTEMPNIAQASSVHNENTKSDGKGNVAIPPPLSSASSVTVGSASSSTGEPEYRRGGPKALDPLLDIGKGGGGNVEIQQVLKERAIVVITRDEGERLNFANRINILMVRCAYYLISFLVLLEYLLKFNDTFLGYRPLPIAGKIMDWFSKKEHCVQVRGSGEDIDSMLNQFILKGECFILFGRSGPSGSLFRFPIAQLVSRATDMIKHQMIRHLLAKLPPGFGRVVNISTDDDDFFADPRFIFESAWSGALCFSIVDVELSHVILGDIISLMRIRAEVNAQSIPALNIVWTFDVLPCEEQFDEVAYLCRALNMRLTICSCRELSQVVTDRLDQIYDLRSR